MKEESATSVDNYEITATIHESAEGIIYRAVEKTSGVKVLIKKYYPALQWSDDILNEFFNLFSYLRFIEHEYLLPILDVGKQHGLPYTVFADDSLTLLSDRQVGQAGQKDTLSFCYHVAEALDFLHKQEILHGTLTPENIALGADGYPQLFDFGLSGIFKRLLLENTDDGFDNLSVSNLKCTSPEQILGRNPTRASDIYAFGIISYYYIFGEFPFNGQHVPEIAASHLNQGIIRTVKTSAGISYNTLQLVQKCIQLEPDARFANFGKILGILERLQAGRRARFPFAKRFTIEKPGKHTRFSWLFPGGIVIILGLLAAYYLYSHNTEPLSTATLAVTTTVPGQPVTKTPKPDIEKPTESNTSPQAASTQPVQIEIAYKPASEGERPLVLSQPISITNIANLREISRLGYGKPEEADVAPDNNHIALATSAGVFIFEGNQLFKWIDPQGWATSVQFSPDGTVLAIGLATGEIQLWDWQGEIKSATLAGHTKKINRILFSQSSLLYSASADQSIIVWNLKSNKNIQTLRAHSQPVNDIAVTSDARILVSCADDQLIRIWDLASGNKLYELDSTYFAGAIKAVAISSDDAYLAAGGASGYLYQWNLLTSPSITDPVPQLRTDKVPVKERIWSLQYIRNDRELLVGVDNGKAITYDAARQEYEGISLSFEIPAPPSKLVDVFGTRFDFDSFSVFRGESIISINWDGKVTSQQAQIISPMFDNLDRLDFSPDGTILAAGGKRGSTHVWNLITNQPIYKNLYPLPFGDPIAPDGSTIAIIVPKTIAVSPVTGEALIEDIYQMKNLSGSQATRDFSQTIPNAHVGYTGDGSIFIAANLTKSKTWDFASGYETYLNGYPYKGCWITASANNNEKLLVNSPAGIFPIWDEHADNLCPKTYQFKGAISAFSNDLSLMVYINQNGLLEGYDISKNTSAWQPYPLNSPATALAISPDGSIIALGDAAGNMSFINGKSGELISKIVSNFGALQAIEFSEDGKKIATTGTDGTARIFGIVDIK